jgi:hypothetical protein
MVKRALKLTAGAVSTTIATRGKGSRALTLDQTSGCGTSNSSFPCLPISNSRANRLSPQLVRAPHLGRVVSEVNDPVFLGCPAGVGRLRVGRVPNEVRAAFEMPDILHALSLVRQTAKMGVAGGGPSICKNKIEGPRKDAEFITVQHSITAYVLNPL